MRYPILSAALLASTALTMTPLVGGAMAEDISLDTITISATRTQASAVESMAGVSVVTQEELESWKPQDVNDIFAGVPGVTVEQAGDDPAAAINIRGLQDFGRVAVTIDGARQNFQTTSHSLGGGSFFLEPELIEEATVVRGPVANVYGSGAIGGVVSFQTKSVDGVLRDGETWAVDGMVGYKTNGDGFVGSMTGAARINETFAALGSVVYRRANNYKDGDGNSIFNSGYEITSGLAKAEFTPGEGHKLVASFLTNNDKYVTGDPGGANYDNKVQDNTAALKYTFLSPDNELIDLSASAYWTNTDLKQTYLTGANIGSKRTFQINTVGFDVNNTSRFSTSVLDHALTIGGDFFHDDVSNYDPAGTGELYTPSGKRMVYGAFVQDEIRYDDWLQVIGALRFDGYSLSGGSTDSDGQRVSPKITVGLTPFEDTQLAGLQLYTTYAEGYRAPSVTETLIAGTHPFPAFDFLPNPDLKPETAHNFEIGVNYQRNSIITDDDRLRLKATWYNNDVDDFIDFATGPLTCGYGFCYPSWYQYQNVASARIRGVELEAQYDAGWMYVGLAGQFQNGENTDTGEALGSIPANRITTTLGFRALENEALNFGVRWQAVSAQDDVPAGVTASDDYNLLDLYASYEPRDGLVFGLNLNNILDEQYTPYMDSDPSPGFNAMFTIKARLGG